MDYEQITFEQKDRLNIITLNRPERRNAWTYQMQAEMMDAISRSNEDPSVGAIILTGAGKSFCAGADMEDTLKTDIEDTLKKGSRDESQDAKQDGETKSGAFLWVNAIRESKPLIAAVNGAAVGIGLTQILPFDVIVASEKARFGMFFIKVGLVPELASTHFLVQRIGFGKASEMCLSGRLYDAKQSLNLGLVDHLVSSEGLMEKAEQIGNEIAVNPIPQLKMIKQLLTVNGSDTDLESVINREGELIRHCYTTPEHHEAVAAFIEKRPPKFQ